MSPHRSLQMSWRTQVSRNDRPGTLKYRIHYIVDTKIIMGILVDLPPSRSLCLTWVRFPSLCFDPGIQYHVCSVVFNSACSVQYCHQYQVCTVVFNYVFSLVLSHFLSHVAGSHVTNAQGLFSVIWNSSWFPTIVNILLSYTAHHIYKYNKVLRDTPLIFFTVSIFLLCDWRTKN